MNVTGKPELREGISWSKKGGEGLSVSGPSKQEGFVGNGLL
jgi:hypothetical protein